MSIYQYDPPVNDAFASFRVKDFDSLDDGSSLTSWATADVDSGSPVYKNDSGFPYIDLNGGHFESSEYSIEPAQGFTFTGLVYTKDLTATAPFTWAYAVAANDGLSLSRSGSALLFRSDKASSFQVEDTNATVANTWEVHTCRITNNNDETVTFSGGGDGNFGFVGNNDGTVTMELFIDNVLKASGNFLFSEMSGIVNGYIGIGNSTVWGNGTATPAAINISDCFFYDRSLSDTELSDMHTYLTTLGDPYPFVVTPQIFRVGVSFTEVDGAQKYRVQITDNGSGDARVTHDDIAPFTTQNSVVIVSVSPMTDYTVKLYVDSGGGYVQIYSANVQTLANLPENYDLTNFGSSGSYDLSPLGTTEWGYIREVLNGLFSTGDNIDINLSNTKTLTSFVGLGGTASSTDNSLLVPFNESSGSGQDILIELSDTSTVQVSYDETNNSVSVDGQNLQVGEYSVVDGKKCSVRDV